MKNKILHILLIAAVVGLSSCNKWLDVSPDDMIEGTDLFESGSGYRTALNGIYLIMAEPSLYGKELSWGAVEAAGNVFKASAFSNTSTYTKIRESKYTDSGVKSIMESVWSRAYHAAVNCNTLISNVSNEPASTFEHGQMEKDLILGEALALRAFLQFDILRLFAPAPIADDNKQYIPYYDTHDSNGSNYLTVAQVIARVEADLKTAKNLLKTCDLAEERKGWFTPDARMLAEQMTDNIAPDDIFFAYRGYRMNYYAATATLARVYSYNGNMNLAAIEAKEVLAATSANANNKCFQLVDSYIENLHGYHEVIFALSRKDINSEYLDQTKAVGNAVDIDLTNVFPESDKTDIRSKDLMQEVNGRSFTKKYMANSKKTDDMIPMIRMSEMIYIVAEEMSLRGDFTNAINELKTIRIAKKIFASGEDNIGAASHDEFMTHMLRDMRKDLVQEGQYFFQYKRLNKKFNTNTLFVFPIPDNENL